MFILLRTYAVKIILPGGWDGFKPKNHNKSLVHFSGEAEGTEGEKMQKAKGEGGEGGSLFLSPNPPPLSFAPVTLALICKIRCKEKRAF